VLSQALGIERFRGMHLSSSLRLGSVALQGHWHSPTGPRGGLPPRSGVWEAEQAWPRSRSPNMCGAEAWALEPYHDALVVPLSGYAASNCAGAAIDFKKKIFRRTEKLLMPAEDALT
jgi:hypothetical protein